MNTSSRPDPQRCGKVQDHARHVWKGRVREVWRDPYEFYPNLAPPTTSVGPWYECSGHLVVEGGHW